MGWRLTWDNLTQREERTLELTVREGPEQALSAIRGYLLSEGRYWEEVATDRVLEVRGVAKMTPPGVRGAALVVMIVT